MGLTVMLKVQITELDISVLSVRGAQLCTCLRVRHAEDRRCLLLVKKQSNAEDLDDVC